MLSFLPEVKFNSGEMAVLVERLKDPIIQKYLSMLVRIEAADFLVNIEPKDGETAEGFLRRQALVRGRIEVLETLISIAMQEPEEGSGNIAG